MGIVKHLHKGFSRLGKQNDLQKSLTGAGVKKTWIIHRKQKFYSIWQKE